jgi:MFS family permease
MTPPKQATVSRGLLPVVLLSLALVVAAVPALNVALPNVASDTGASLSQMQWIVDSYALVFAGLLLPAGALGDRYGRKPVLVLGLAVFAVGSAVATFAHDRTP